MKMYFKSIDDNFCQKLMDFSFEELEELNYKLIEAEPDNGKSEFIWCSYKAECIEKQDCNKSNCHYYKSKTGKSKCDHKGNLYWHGKEVDVKSEVQKLQKHEYMMLSRLKQDCEFYLNYGNRNPKILWAGNEKEHLEEMDRLWDLLKVKPEWLSKEKLEEYKKQIVNNEEII